LAPERLSLPFLPSFLPHVQLCSQVVAFLVHDKIDDTPPPPTKPFKLLMHPPTHSLTLTPSVATSMHLKNVREALFYLVHLGGAVLLQST
jgi:hypothetical protein